VVSFTIISCDTEDDTKDTNNVRPLPTEFPLEVGNAFVYERLYYTNNQLDSTVLDTLYVYEMEGSYYKYSFRPWEYYNLVKNVPNMFLSYGTIYFSAQKKDTFMYDKPDVWMLYGFEGSIDTSEYSANYDLDVESWEIEVENEMKFAGNIYNAYKNIFNHGTDYTVSPKREVYAIEDGFAQWNYYDADNNLVRQTKLKTVLKDTFPPTKKSSAQKSKNLDELVKYGM